MASYGIWFKKIKINETTWQTLTKFRSVSPPFTFCSYRTLAQKILTKFKIVHKFHWPNFFLKINNKSFWNFEKGRAVWQPFEKRMLFQTTSSRRGQISTGSEWPFDRSLLWWWRARNLERRQTELLFRLPWRIINV